MLKLEFTPTELIAQLENLVKKVASGELDLSDTQASDLHKVPHLGRYLVRMKRVQGTQPEVARLMMMSNYIDQPC